MKMMKKNKMMRAASVLLVATLLTTCVTSGTFAKYTTESDGSDNARVAKFGVTITANGTTFAKEYATHDDRVSTIAKSVISTDNNVVAPGTSGTLAASTITGTPEVAVNVKRTAELTLTGWEDGDSNYYCPIIITVGSTEYAGTDYASIAEFKAAVEGAIQGDSKNYGPGTDLSTKSGDTLNVTWKWPFHVNADKDAKDTQLGNQGSASTIQLAIKTTVTQID